MNDKLLILSTKTSNMRIVLTNLAYACDVTRPEQRGLLSAKEGDIALLFDIDRQALIGPFTLSSDPFYWNETLWERKWNYYVTLEPLLYSIGVLEGKRLLDVLLDVGRLSVRDHAALTTYWIHNIIADEANSLLEAFPENAVFSTSKVLSEYDIDINDMKPLEYPDGEIMSLDEKIALELCSGRISEWMLEGYVSRHHAVLSKLVPFDDTIRAAGVYLYGRRFLDVAAYSRKANWRQLLKLRKI